MISNDDLDLDEELTYGFLESSVSKYRGSTSLTFTELLIVYSSNEGSVIPITMFFWG